MSDKQSQFYLLIGECPEWIPNVRKLGFKLSLRYENGCVVEVWAIGRRGADVFSRKCYIGLNMLFSGIRAIKDNAIYMLQRVKI